MFIVNNKIFLSWIQEKKRCPIALVIETDTFLNKKLQKPAVYITYIEIGAYSYVWPLNSLLCS